MRGITGRSIFLAIAIFSAITSQARNKVNTADRLTYVWIPPGTFAMGCSPADKQCYDWEPSSHVVAIVKGFWIGQTEVTQDAFQRVTGKNPSKYRGSRRPVDQVSWQAANRYCAAVGMRLPTGVEWEYAARGGSSDSRYGELGEVAWYDGNSGDMTHGVALKRPNGYGLYDTLGNVWEWVDDDYVDASGRRKILRGGSFFNPARELRVSNRLWATPDAAHRNMGMRCAGD